VNVDALGSRRVGVLGETLPAQPVVEQVRDREQNRRDVELGIAGAHHARELKEGVDLHDLDPGRCVDRVSRHPVERQLHDPVCPGIAIVVRVAEKTAVAVEECEVDTPAVNSQPAHRPPLVSNVFGDARLDLRPQPERIPVEVALHGDRPVVESVQLAQIEADAIPSAGKHPAVRGTEVDGQVLSRPTHPCSSARGAAA
jgi:hypothetical protein